MRCTRRLATWSVLALALGLGAPAAAGAAQKDVSLGPSKSAEQALNRTGNDVNDFFPHEVTIHAGDKVVTWYISANRDEEAFDDPDRFDVTRKPNEHVTFGPGGPHFCLGAHLARLEAKAASRR